MKGPSGKWHLTSRKILNYMKIKLPAISVNEGIARTAVAAFCSRIDPTAMELADLKCAVSEAVTNCIVHAYAPGNGEEGERERGEIRLSVFLLEDSLVRVEIADHGRGIPDVRQAMEPLYTTDPDGERSGMGFTVMESFCDRERVRSVPGRGTTVILWKQFNTPGC